MIKLAHLYVIEVASYNPEATPRLKGDHPNSFQEDTAS